MVQIQRYREWLIELAHAINAQAVGHSPIQGVLMAVHEGHLLRKLKDKRGVWLCGKYPDGQVKGAADAFSTDNEVLLFLLEKVPSGQHDEEDELQHYQRMQRLMVALRERLWDGNLLCDESIRLSTDLKIEWEYDIFGGWNGLSISFKLEDFE